MNDLCDRLDAEVFSGDALTDPETQRMFRAYLESWMRALKQYEEDNNEQTMGDQGDGPSSGPGPIRSVGPGR